MAIYAVHQPPPRKYEGSPDPERFAFVRDGFSFWAFLYGPLWMLRHRMWLVIMGYIALVVAVAMALRLTGSPGGVRAFAVFMLMLLVGLEAGSLRRFTLGRRRWKNVGVIVGDDRESAERRFFDSWVHGETLAPLAAAPAAPPLTPMPAGQPGPDVIGLFPQPGTRR
jgi:hypothetical protein